VELARQKNLEVPTKGKPFKHSFASICNDALADKATRLKISLGGSVSSINDNIGKIKHVEKSRMENLFDKQPEVFLPAEIDITLEDIMENGDKDISPADHLEDMENEVDDPFDSLESPCCSRKSGKGKNKKKHNAW
jgi:hypothetical protein